MFTFCTPDSWLQGPRIELERRLVDALMLELEGQKTEDELEEDEVFAVEYEEPVEIEKVRTRNWARGLYHNRQLIMAGLCGRNFTSHFRVCFFLGVLGDTTCDACMLILDADRAVVRAV